LSHRIQVSALGQNVTNLNKFLAVEMPASALPSVKLVPRPSVTAGVHLFINAGSDLKWAEKQIQNKEVKQFR